MKTVTAIVAAGLATFGFASSVLAGPMFMPPNANFIAQGSLTVTAGAVSLPCTANLKGTTHGDTATITSAKFTGLSCLALSAGNLPWGVSITNIRNIVISHIEVSALVLGVCGPGNVPVYDTVTGKLTISGAGLPGGLLPCSVSATFNTKPALHVIVKK